eukprot:gene22314-158_t
MSHVLDVEEDTQSWEEFGLDDRLLQGIRKQKWEAPTLVQSGCIPLAMQGKDILAKAPTGCGKTGAFCIPAIQKVLHMKANGQKMSNINVLMLPPTRELASQIHRMLLQLLRYLKDDVSVLDISQVPKSALVNNPSADIVISTPALFVQHLKHNRVPSGTMGQLSMVVVDEADLVFATSSMKFIRSLYPTTVQTILMSATLTPEVIELKNLILNKPFVIKLEEGDVMGDLDEDDDE